MSRVWDVYNCTLNDQQKYNGTSEVYLPLVQDAVNARAKSFSRMMFPQNRNHVACISETGDIPHARLAMMNHYIRKSGLRTLIPALFRCGDIEGTYILAVDWKSRTGNVTVRRKMAIEDEFGGPIAGTEEWQEVEDEAREQTPEAEILATEDVIFLPTNVATTDDCEIIGRRRRMSKKMIEQWAELGFFDKAAAKELCDNIKATRDSSQAEDAIKRAVENAGVKYDRAMELAIVYEIWCLLDLPKLGRRRCVFWYYGQDEVLGCIRNPFNNDRVPIFGAAREFVRGSVWGNSAIEGGVETLQYGANDAINEGMDSSQYTLNPIIMSDPAKNPRLGSVVMAMMAIWEVDPNSTKIVELPQIWKDAFQMVGALKEQIFQSMGVSPAMIPGAHVSAQKKPTQSQVAQENQSASEIVQDEVEVMESAMMDQLLRWYADLDEQFRRDDLVVPAYGRMGVQLKLERVTPIQRGMDRYTYIWIGTEAFKSAQRAQMKIAALNVMRGVPPNQLNGLVLNVAPALQELAEEMWGPEIAPRILVDPAETHSLDPQAENEMMAEGLPVPVSPLDNPKQHIMVHMAALKGADEKTKALLAAHIQQHMAAAQAKAAQIAGQGQPGVPGGAGQPGVAGTPRVGAQPQAPRGGQQPPGAVHKDRLPMGEPRKAIAPPT